MFIIIWENILHDMLFHEPEIISHVDNNPVPMKTIVNMKTLEALSILIIYTAVSIVIMNNNAIIV